MTATFRNAVPADYEAFTELFLELGVQDPVPTADMFAKMCDACLIAEQGDAVVGYCIYRSTGTAGHVNNLVVGRSVRGRGIGEGLLRRAAANLAAAGCSTWSLYVKQDNEAAKRLYKRLGFKWVHTAAVVCMAWSDIAATQPGSPDEVVIDVSHDSQWDETISSVLEFGEGVLARFRQSGNFILMAALIDGQPIGFAGFQPGFPHIRLMRAAGPSTAIALLQQLARHRTPIVDPEHPWRQDSVQIFVERQQRLAEGLVAVGAEVVLQLDHMRGDLPQAHLTPVARTIDVEA